MQQRTSNTHWATTFSSLLLLLGAILHCPWEWKTALAQMNIAANHREARQSLPIGMPPSGCDESGCICRGATVAAAVDASGLSPSETDGLSLIAKTPSPAAVFANSNGRQAGHWAAGTPFQARLLSGRQLRALYASLVL